MAQLSVRTENDQVVVELQGASGLPMSVPLDRREVVALMATLTQALNALPFDPSAPIYGEQPVFGSRNPSFQVGLTDDGDCLLALRPDPLPPMHFQFDAEKLALLIEGLRSAALVPAASKGRQ